MKQTKLYSYITKSRQFLDCYISKLLNKNKETGSNLAIKQLTNKTMKYGLMLGFGLVFIFAFMPAKAYAADSFSLTSNVKDAGAQRDFTTLTWSATTPADTWIGDPASSSNIYIEFRAGNTATPDGSWQAYAQVANGGSIASFSGKRYFQYKANMNSNSASAAATLSSVSANYSVYVSPGTLGGTVAGNVGLRFDAEEGGNIGRKVHASQLNWVATTGSSGQKVLFKVRAGDTQAELDANQCYGPTALDSGCADWTTAGKFFSQINSGGTTTTNPASLPGSILNTISYKRYVEVLVRLESDGSNTPTLSEVILTYDLLENPVLGNTTIYKQDGSTQVSTGGTENTWTNETTVKIKATGLTCTSCGTSTNRKIEVEYKPTASNFDGTGTVLGDSVPNGGNYDSTATISGLTAGTGYHLRMRTLDTEGRVSGWTSYGSGTDTAPAAADFTIEQTPPTGTVTINAGDAYTTSTSVTLTISASDTGGSGMGQMQFSNDGTTWSSWEAYATSKAWTLTSGDGTKTVYVLFKDGAGNISDADGAVAGNQPYTDTIILDTTAPTEVTISGYSDNTKTTSLTSGTWYSYSGTNSPYFEFSATDTGGSGLAGYNVYFGTNNTVDPQTGGTFQAGNTYSPSGLVSNTTYYLRIKAKDNVGNFSTNVSEFIYRFDNSPPADVSGFSQTDKTAISISLSWNAATDTGSGISGYRLERKKATDSWGGPTQTNFDLGNVTAYIDQTGLEAGYKYNYRIKAKDSTNPTSLESPNWTEVDGWTVDDVPPSNPSNVQANPCDGTNNCSAPPESYASKKGFEIKLTWTASSDAGVGMDKYLLWRRAVTDDSRIVNKNTGIYESTGEQVWTLVGELPAGPLGTQTEEYYDNDSNNNATGTYVKGDGTTYVITSPQKTSASPQLNDFVIYYYRIQAIDNNGNRTGITPELPTDPDINKKSATTPDVTAPTITQISSVTANSITEIQVNWNQWPDKTSRDTNLNGSGVAEYVVERSYDGTTGWVQIGDLTGSPPSNQFLDHEYDSYDTYGSFSTLSSDITDLNPADGGNITVADGTNYPASGRIKIDNEYIDYTSKLGNSLQNITRGKLGSTKASHTAGATVYIIERFKSIQTYYYRMKAKDAAPYNNWSGYTSNTASSYTTSPDATAPSTPTDGNAVSLKGDPASNSNIGHQITLAWKGSQDNSKIKGYKVYRSTQNPEGVSADVWKSGATSLATVNLSGTTSNDETGITYTYVDNNSSNASTSPSVSKSGGTASASVSKQVTTGLSDATQYFYRVLAFDDASPAALESSLSSPSGLNTRASDYTPDATAPQTPQEVKLQAIWGANPGDIRLVVTWKTIDIPQRNGTNDFKEYRLYKSLDNATFSQVLVNTQNPLYNADKTIGRQTNYYVDSDIDSTAQGNKHYYYYVVGVDDAGEVFKYPDPPYTGAPVINPPYNNVSAQSTKVDLKPSEVIPTIILLSNSKKAQVTSVGVSSATIYWETNQPTESVVSYRKAGTNDEFITAGTEGLILTHSVTIRALEAGTPYEYRVSGKNAIGNDKKVGYGQPDDGVGDNNTGNDDVQPLTTSAFSISHNLSTDTTTSTTTATINWSTPIESDSNVEYQLQKNPGEAEESSKTAGDPALTKNHSVTIKALRPGRTYTYKIRSVTSDKYVAETQFLTFQTKPYDVSMFSISPSASRLSEQAITATSAKITWSTEVATSSWVDFGTQSGRYISSAGSNDLTKSHVVELNNLTPNMLYYYRVRGKDQYDIEYISQEYTFRALAQPEITNIQVKEVKPYSAVISWSTNIPTDSGVSYSTELPYTKREQSQDLVTSHQLTLAKLTDQTTYHFQIEIKDDYGHIAKSEDKTFTTPLDTEGPKLSEVKISPMTGADPSKRGVVITWLTDKEATAQVEYSSGVTTGKYDSKSPVDPSYNVSHTVFITDLEPGTTYHFRLVSKDRRGNEGKSQDYTMLTQEKEESILSLILKTLEDTFSWVGKVKDFVANQFSKLMGGK